MAMELKSYLIAPTPGRVCAFLPAKSINNAIQAPISAFSIRQVFHTLCYDANEGDPWEHLNAIQQGCLTDEMKPGRMKTARHVLDNVTVRKSVAILVQVNLDCRVEQWAKVTAMI